jgi:hypothetical protein
MSNQVATRKMSAWHVFQLSSRMFAALGELCY